MRSDEGRFRPDVAARDSRAAAPYGAKQKKLRAGCPMVEQGAGVTVADTEGGVALTFTTDIGDVADVRTRVQHMAQMYAMHHGQAGMMWHPKGGQGMGGEGMGYMAGRGPCRQRAPR
jgi:hypothetical protein